MHKVNIIARLELIGGFNKTQTNCMKIIKNNKKDLKVLSAEVKVCSIQHCKSTQPQANSSKGH